MRYLALACDYDGTLAHDGRVDHQTVVALKRVLASGRKLILATGRERAELESVCPHLDLFTWVAAEDGALLFRPGSREEKGLGEPPPRRFVETLRQRGVPISVGRVIVATVRPHENAVLETIRDLGLELQVIFNKGAVMVLPAGINKATGLMAALREMELSPHNVAGIGDAENDHAFLGVCEFAAAVANGLPMLKAKADYVTRGGHGAGVAELIDELVTHDLARYQGRLTRHDLLLGTRPDGTEVRLPPAGGNLLIAGPSGSGKSSVAAGLLERLADDRYQFAIMDPEGDYDGLENVVTLGDRHRSPGVEEVLQLLKKPKTNAVINLVGLPLADRPESFLQLLPRLLEMRNRTGRPHWVVVDEAHHLLPASWQGLDPALPKGLDGLALITVHPDLLAPTVLARMDTVIAVGPTPEDTLEQFCRALGKDLPRVPAGTQAAGEVVLWLRTSGAPPLRLRPAPHRTERRRHTRKYAEGELPPERSFYFEGPEGKLHLRAQNLIIFNQLAEGVDDATWMHHLKRGDYSHWFRACIKDPALADESAKVEQQVDLSPADSRRRIREVIQAHYTLPASPSFPVPGTDAAENRAGEGDGGR